MLTNKRNDKLGAAVQMYREAEPEATVDVYGTVHLRK